MEKEKEGDLIGGGGVFSVLYLQRPCSPSYFLNSFALQTQNVLGRNVPQRETFYLYTLSSCQSFYFITFTKYVW